MPKSRNKTAADKAAAPEPRAASTLAEATEIGLFGNEVDATPDSEYTASNSGRPDGHYAIAGAKPAPKETP